MPTLKLLSWQCRCRRCQSFQVVFGADHSVGCGLAAWTSCCYRQIDIGLVAETVEDAMTVVEADTLLGSATTAENERIAKSAVRVLDRGRLKSVGSWRLFAERSETVSKDLMATIRERKVLGRLEERSHETPGLVLVQAWE